MSSRRLARSSANWSPRAYDVVAGVVLAARAGLRRTADQFGRANYLFPAGTFADGAEVGVARPELPMHLGPLGWGAISPSADQSIGGRPAGDRRIAGRPAQYKDKDGRQDDSIGLNNKCTFSWRRRSSYFASLECMAIVGRAVDVTPSLPYPRSCCCWCVCDSNQMCVKF